MTTTTATTDTSIASRLIVGRTRVRDGDGFCGTVEYVGPVASAKNEDEVYAGIAWDDPSRGKHDGSVICRRTNQLVRHFHCEGGSFLRLNKLDLGVALDLGLLQSKYVKHDAPLVAPNNILPHSARTSSGRDKPIEFLGEIPLREHQQVEQLTRMALRNMGISSISPQLAGHVDQVNDLDLGGNLLWDWNVVKNILEAFPNLSKLSIAYNRMGNLSDDVQLPHSHSLEELNLHSCGIASYHTVQALSDVFPNLRELCVASNHLVGLATVDAVVGFHSLTCLDLSNCGLTSWPNEVDKLSLLPSLETLSLSNNAIKSMPNPLSGFLQLKHINLTLLAVRDWPSIQGLSALPKLTSLSMQSTPLTSSMGAAEIRYQLIARFPRIETLHSSPIAMQERSEAEKRYVSQVTQELLFLQKENDQEEYLKQKHPRFAELADKYQSILKRQGGNGGGPSSYTATVTIISMASESCQVEPIQRRLPSSLTIGRLKSICWRAFGLDIDLQVLYYRTKADAFPTELTDNSCTLAYYGVEDGGEILINERDINNIKGEEQRQRDEFEQRIIDQEHKVVAMQELKADLRQKGLM